MLPIVSWRCNMKGYIANKENSDIIESIIKSHLNKNH